MKLFEMKKDLPATAGIAKIRYMPVHVPMREGAVITLPNYCEDEFFPLQQGRQFLFRKNGRCWFGGTDELPFLAEVRQEAFEDFKNDGEDGFYDSLRPDLIDEMESELDVETKRQGDIFALPLPLYSWKGFRDPIFRLVCGGVQPAEDDKGKVIETTNIFTTRHILKDGRFHSFQRGQTPVMIADGLLTAPDHEPLRLQGPHLLVQAQNLTDPRNAD